MRNRLLLLAAVLAVVVSGALAWHTADLRVRVTFGHSNTADVEQSIRRFDDWPRPCQEYFVGLFMQGGSLVTDLGATAKWDQSIAQAKTACAAT